MKIKFILKFDSVQGQNIMISGNCPELGEWDNDKAVYLNYMHGGYWMADLDIASESFEYTYLLKDERYGSIIPEWAPRLFTNPSPNKNIVVYETWNYPDLPEFNLNTALFEHLTPQIKNPPVSENEKNTHRFRIPFRIMNPNETLCVIGNYEGIGSWNEEYAAQMIWDGKGHWYVDVDISKAAHVIEYKYVVKNTDTGYVKYYEEGSNRYALPVQKGEFAVYNDIALRQPQHEKWRGSGLAVPVFSLRTEKGLGTGEFSDLIEFGKWAKDAGFSMIQILPVHDTTAKFNWTDSYPYAAISVYALHPMYVRLRSLKGLTKDELKEINSKAKVLNSSETVDYEQVTQFKNEFLKKYFTANFKTITSDRSFERYLDENAEWVKPYAIFSVLRDENKTADFTQWKKDAKSSSDLAEKYFKPRNKYYKEVLFYVFIQWQLHEQLSEAVNKLHEMNITLKGDLPIGIYRHSADAWWNPELFNMDQQAGAPPDDFAVLGQNWEFPTYNWSKMQEDGFSWWKSRFQFMSRYFDAFRIDHILGFFRIWQIPLTATQGILGRFEPALPVTEEELHHRGIHLDRDRLIQPYIHYDLLSRYFGNEVEQVIEKYFDYKNEYGELRFKEEFNSQRKITQQLGDHGHKERLLELAANVLFIKEEGESFKLHPRFGMSSTNNYKWLQADYQRKLDDLYVDYFFKRQEEFWKQKGLEKLPALKQATNMLTCGEDLGMVPKVVPQVMRDLAILSLQVQRMPSDEKVRFSHPNDAPYLSVVSPSSHDTSTLRQWWKENRDNTQYFFNHIMGIYGSAPQDLHPDLLAKIIEQHLYSPAMLSVIPLQEFLGIDMEVRNENEDIERINIPAVFPHYWRYRMHLNIADLQKNTSFTQRIREMHRASGRK